MGDASCTIRFDRTAAEAVRRRQMRTLLMSSALATALAGVLQPGVAQAACPVTSSSLSAVTYTCSVSVNNFNSIDFGRNITVQGNGVVFNSNGSHDGLFVLSNRGFFGGGNVFINLNNPTIDGAQNGVVGISLNGFGDASTTVKLVGGTVTANSGDGISAWSGSLGHNATVDVDVSSVIDATGGTGITAVAGSVSGDLDDFQAADLTDPSSLEALVGPGKATVHVTTKSSVTGSDNGIFALGIGTHNDVQVTAKDDVTAENGFGILAGSVGPDGKVKIKATGDVSGTMGGILGYNTSGDVDVSSSGKVSVASGGFVGVGAISNGGNATVNVTGDIDPPLVGALAVAIGNGTATSNTSGGTIDADVIGVLGLNVGNGRVDVDNDSRVLSSGGAFPIAGVAGVKVGDGVGSGPVDVNVVNSGRVSDFGLGVVGLAFGDGNRVNVENSGSVTVPGVAVLGGAVGDNSKVTVLNQGPISGGLAGVVGFAGGDNSTVKVTNQGAVSTDGVGVAGVLAGDNGKLDVINQAGVSAGVLGVGGLAFGNNNKVNVDTAGASVFSGGAGVFGGAVGNGNTVNVDTDGKITGEYLGVGGLIAGNGNKLDIVTRSDVDSASGFGVAGLGFGDNNSIKVTTRDYVSGDLLGVGALNFGSNSKVTVDTKDEVDSASGFGVFGGAIGSANNKVDITTESKVTGDLLGVGGIVAGSDSKLTIETQDKVTSDSGFGVAGLGFGSNVNVDITTDKAVKGDLLGVGGLVVGDSADLTIKTKGKVTSDNGFGVFGGAIGNGATADITTNKAVEGKYLGVGGLVAGDNSELTIKTKDTVTSEEGFGVAGLGFGNNVTLDVTTKDVVEGKYLGVGALLFGSGTVDVETQEKVTSSDGVGVFGGAIGSGPSDVTVTTQKKVEGKYLGVGGVVVGDNSSLAITTQKKVVSSDGVGVAGFAAGSGLDVKVETQDDVTGKYLGVGALGFGDGSLSVHTMGTVEAADGVGVIGGLIGTGVSNVDVTTDKAVTAKYLGVGGILGGHNSTLDVTTKGPVNVSEGFGVAALSFGNTNTINVTTEDTVVAPLLGVGALSIGNDTILNVTTKKDVTAVDGIGVLGGNIGSGGQVTVTNEGTVHAGLAGVVGFNTGGAATVNVKNKVTVADGGFVGAAAIAGGSGNAILNVNAMIDPPIIGGITAQFGSGTAIANVTAEIQAHEIGLLGVHIGDTGAAGNLAIDINVNPGIATGGKISSDGVGISTFALGRGTTDIYLNGAIGGLAPNTATGSDGILALAIGDSPVKIETTAAGIINAGEDGISVGQFGSGDIWIKTAGVITAGDEGIQVLTAATGNVFVNNTAAINAGDNGIFILKSGNGKTTVQADANITANTGNGIEANSLFGNGDVVVSTKDVVPPAAGVKIVAADYGIVASKFFGDGAVSVDLGDYSSISGVAASGRTTLGGIAAVKGFGNGNVSVTTGIYSSIATDGVGIYANKSFGNGDVSVSLGDYAKITGYAGGIQSLQSFGIGANSVTTGINSEIFTYGTGIFADSFFTNGATSVTTGTNSTITASVDGVVARKFGGTGNVTATVGASSAIYAGDDGVVATNFAFGPNNTVLVDVKGGSSVDYTTIQANNDAIRAGGWDDVTVQTGSYAVITGDADHDRVGNAIRVFRSDNAVVNIGTYNIVTGSGQSWADAVISVRSRFGSDITIGANSFVSSWHTNIVDAASDIVLDVDGGAATVENFGTVLGRVGLTNQSDTLYNRGIGSWTTVGNNYFGYGTDVVYNQGYTQTAVQGQVAETTSFLSLERFVNGDLGSGYGYLSMIDGEVVGSRAYNADRDVTYVSGVFAGVGNSRLGVDAFLAGPGSTSDVLRIGAVGVANGTLATEGQTAVVVRDVSGGPGAFNIPGILVVDVVNNNAITYGKNDPNHQASFVISPESQNYSAKFGGVIDKGLFFYDILVRGNDTYLVGLPDQEVFELPKLITGAQSIWHETTGVWLDRQADLRTYMQGTPTQSLVTKEGIVKAVGTPTQSVTPGVWAKAVGSWGSRDATDNYGVLNGFYSFNTGYSQNTYGLIAGADFGKEGVFGRNDAVIFGVLGGYLTSDLSFDGSPSSASYSGGTVGLYATYLNDAWFVDGLFQADFLSMDYKAPTLFTSGYYGQSADVTNLGFTIDTGYRFKWGATGFFEPLATISYVNSNIGSLPMFAGTVVDFGNNDSLRGSLGARVGGQLYDTAGYWVEGSVTGRVWYEFLADNSVTIFNPGVPFSTVDNFDGLFGEVGAGLNVFGKGNGWNGFANASVKFGDNYTAGNARGGVRYQW